VSKCVLICQNQHVDMIHQVLGSSSPTQQVSPVAFQAFAAGSSQTGITKATSAGNYISWLRASVPVVGETTENKDVGPPEGDNEMNNRSLRFSYPTRPDTKVLRGISTKVSLITL
jgi:hypothetical protein